MLITEKQLIAEENHECTKAKCINKNVVDDKLKYEDYKNVLFKIQKPIELIKFLCLVTMTKNIKQYYYFINNLS